MIKEQIVVGSESTVYHTFSYSQTGMTLAISAGSFYEAGVTTATCDTETDITFPTLPNDTQYMVYLANDNNFYVTHWTIGGTNSEPPHTFTMVDRMAWLTIPANATTLDSVDVNVLVVNKQ